MVVMAASRGCHSPVTVWVPLRARTLKAAHMSAKGAYGSSLILRSPGKKDLITVGYCLTVRIRARV